MASISSLPDELVSHILDFLPWGGPDGSWLCAWRASILLVCKRWHSLFEPKLFERVRVSHAAAYGARGIRPEVFIDILNQYPYLGNHVRDVVVTTSPREKEHEAYRQYEQVFDRIMPVARLEVSSMTEALMPLIQRAATNNHVSTINLKQVSFSTILRLFGSSDLRKLCLRGSRWQDDAFARRPYPVFEDTPPPSSLEAAFPSLTPRTGSLKCLRLKSLGTSPAHLAVFFAWPAALEDVEFEHIRDFTKWSLESLGPLLAMHQASLKRISIGALPLSIAPPPTIPSSSPPSIPSTFPLNFTTYPHLTHLTLTFHTLFAYPAHHIGHVLSAPNLTHLTLAFHTETQYGASFADFSSLHPRFLTTMVRTLRAAQPSPRLKTVYIDFDPWQALSASDPDFLAAVLHDPTWPWVYVEEARRKLAAEEGVVLSYHAPNVSRGRWEGEVRGILDRYRAIDGREMGQMVRW